MTSSPSCPGPLAGIRVLELSTVVLGPWACQILGDYGADVVKVEPPGGDSNRRIGPGGEQAMGALFLACNRNKRSVVLDLKQRDGREAALALAARADVLVHNYRPTALARLGLGYGVVRQANPRIVYCGTYGYGRRGPYADRPAYDDSIQAASGLAALPVRMGGEPAYVPTIIADKTTALAVVGAVTAALFHRERTGQGQEIEVPMFETMVSFLMAEHLYGAAFDPPRGTAGYPRLLTAFRRPYRTRDGYLAVLPYLDEHWKAFCEAAGRPDLATHPDYATLSARQARIGEVYEQVAALVALQTTQAWLEALGPRGVPLTVVRSLDEVLEDEHLAAVGFWSRIESAVGPLRTTAIPTAFSATPGTIRRPPPRLGEHTEEALRDAGVPDAVIARVISRQPPS
jgi:crotonobetainyl-CoA:carnitine CoA-transferase CaiB-like acyl-CoA transferase